jgi:hypothetical protein
VRAHALFDRREVGLGDDDAGGELEVVVEAVSIGGPIEIFTPS